MRNPDYFKKDRPYLDEITVRTIDSRATRMLAFSTGDYDITFPSDVSIPLMKDVKARAPNAICEVITTGTLINLMVNRVNPPFDNPDIRKAMSLALDRKPFNSILMEGTARLGGAMLPKPEGEWGMPAEMQASLTGYGSEAEKNLAEAQAIMQKLGYSDAKPLQIKIQTRNLPTYRDPAVILSDQLKKIYIVAELDILDTPRWYAKLQRRITRSASTSPASASTTPTATSSRIIRATPSATIPSIATPMSTSCWRRSHASSTRKSGSKMVWDIERILVEDAARPVILHGSAGNCWQPHVKNFKPHDNSQYNNLRFEDVWLDK